MRRPWNIANPSVYALTTMNEGEVNLNICTYVMAISRKPKMYAISIEKGSKTLENIDKNKECVLQLLHHSQYHLIRPLGKKTGYNFDKKGYLEKKKLLTEWNGQCVLKKCCAYILIEIQNNMETGDHFLFTGKAIKYKTLNESNILTFQDLIDRKIIL